VILRSFDFYSQRLLIIFILKMATRTVTTKYKWKTGNISHQLSSITVSKVFVSDVFSLDGKASAKFLMSLGRGNPNYHDLRLACVGLGRNQEIQLSVKNHCEYSGGVVEVRQEKKLKFNKSGSTYLIGSYDTSNLVADARYDTFSICIEIQHEVPVNDDEFDSGLNELTDRSEFGQNILELYSNGLADVTIQVGGEEFRANKVTLMGYSDVFKRMLSCPNSTEAKTGVIKMENAKPEVIKALVRWIYQAKLDNMNEVAVDLYRTADKYQIGLLKKVCAKAMTNRLSNENAPSRLILAYEYSEEELKQAILDFLGDDNKNVKSLIASDEWSNFSVKDPELRKKALDDIYA